MNCISKTELQSFPKNVQNDTMNALKAYNEVTISYEYGKYSVWSGSCIKACYGADHKVFGIVRAIDVYTEDERTQNYMECFRDYPIWYKGKRDYQALKAKYGECADMN